MTSAQMVLLSWLVALSMIYELLIRWAGHDIGTSQLVFLQSAIALSIFRIRAGRFGRREQAVLSPRDIAVGFLSAFLGVLGGQVLYCYAVARGHLGVVSTIVVFPYEGIWGALLFGETLSKSILVGWCIAMLGMCLLFGVGRGTDESVALLPLFAALLCGLFFTLSTAVRRYFSSSISETQASKLILYASVAIAAMLSVGSGQITQFPRFAAGWLICIGLGALVAISTRLMTRAARSMPLAWIGSAYLVKPVFSFISGEVFFNEQIQAFQAVGALTVVAGAAVALGGRAWLRAFLPLFGRQGRLREDLNLL